MKLVRNTANYYFYCIVSCKTNILLMGCQLEECLRFRTFKLMPGPIKSKDAKKNVKAPNFKVQMGGEG